MVSKDVYVKTGGYDPEFFLQCEDFDWQLRAKKLGFKIMYAHKAKIWHKESMTLGKRSARKAYYDTRNPLVAVRKNCEPCIAKAYLRARLRSFGPALLKNMTQGRFCVAWAMLSGLCSGLTWKQRPGV
jgi:GT2 family glycosyltransferase